MPVEGWRIIYTTLGVDYERDREKRKRVHDEVRELVLRYAPMAPKRRSALLADAQRLKRIQKQLTNLAEDLRQVHAGTALGTEFFEARTGTNAEGLAGALENIASQIMPPENLPTRGGRGRKREGLDRFMQEWRDFVNRHAGTEASGRSVDWSSNRARDTAVTRSAKAVLGLAGMDKTTGALSEALRQRPGKLKQRVK